MDTMHPRFGVQLPLLREGPRPQAVRIPDAIEADLIETLATLLLEAAGAVTEITERPDGGADESEDHA